MPNQFGDCSNLIDYLDKRTVRRDGCLEFTNKPNSCGYGILAPQSYLAKKYGEKLLHRIVYTHYYGLIPEGKCIMHTCDNRMCVEIDHLKLGTWADNNKDRAAKGRNGNQRGETATNVKLTEEQVLVIRELQGEFSSVFLGKFLGLHYSTICYIWNRKLWRHI